MNAVVILVLQILAIMCFIAAAVELKARVNLIALGLALWTIAAMLPRTH